MSDESRRNLRIDAKKLLFAVSAALFVASAFLIADAHVATICSRLALAFLAVGLIL